MSPSPPRTGSEASRPPTDWGRVADGVFLAGLGIFFLVATTRGLPDGFWLNAVSFWPVLLVSVGIRIVFDKTRLAWGVVLGPAVVLLSLFWLAWGEPPAPFSPEEWHAVSAEKPPGAEDLRVRGELAGAEVRLETRALLPTRLVDGRAASRNRTPTLRVDQRDGHMALRLQGRRGGFMVLGTRREVWELALGQDLPLSLDLEGAFVRAGADLRTGWVTDGQLDGAFNAVLLRLPPTSDRVDIRLQGAFSTFDVAVPEGTPVYVKGPGFPLNWVHRGPARDDGRSHGELGYNLIVEGAFCVVDIEEGSPPEGGWPAPRSRPQRRRPEPKPDDTPPHGAGGEEAHLPGNGDGAGRPPAEAPPG